MERKSQRELANPGSPGWLLKQCVRVLLDHNAYQCYYPDNHFSMEDVNCSLIHWELDLSYLDKSISP